MKLLLSLALVGAVWLLAATPKGQAAIQTGLDLLDRRPSQTVLLIGNSRTYYHDMPAMIRRIADSAGSPVRLAITMRAWGGASFEENWSDAGVQDALKQRWDWVILQPESRTEANAANQASFQTYGERLIRSARNAGSAPALIVNWTYAFPDESAAESQAYGEAIRQDTRLLANRAGAELIDTGAAWDEVHSADGQIPLWEDGNHPTVYGSYLSALMIYGSISHAGVDKVSYRPDGVSAAAAQIIKAMVKRQLPLSG